MDITKENRPELARKRLVSVLTRHGIANARTLEQKISDAGPSNQRVDPHILTPARNALVQEGQIKRITKSNVTWYHLANTPMPTVEKRLEEQLPIYQGVQDVNFKSRVGECLEIAIYRALLRQNTLEYFGGFKNLEKHGDSKRYSKEEHPEWISGKSLGGKKLDFLICHKEAGLAGIEAKNGREWLYPNRKEIKDLLRKAVILDCVPVLIARRFPFVTFKILSACGLVFHQNYNQLMPEADSELAEKAQDKRLLGYHDIRVGNQPDGRLIKFVTINLPQKLPQARERFDEHKDLLDDFASGRMDYKDFRDCVLGHSQGADEDAAREPPDDYR